MTSHASVLKLGRAAFSGESVRLLLRTGAIVLARAGGAAMTLAYIAILTRLMPPEALGRAMAAISTAFLASVFLSLNIESGSIRFLVRYLAKGETARAAGFVVFSLQTIAVVFPVALAGLVLYAAVSGASLSGALLRNYAIALCASPLLAFSRVAGRQATALDAVLQGALPRMLVQPFLFTLTFAVMALLGRGISDTFVVGLFLVSACAASVLQILLLRPRYRFLAGTARDTAPRGAWIRTGVMLIPMLISSEFLKDLLIASSALGMAASDVARFSVAISLVGLVQFSLNAVDMTLSPRISRALVDENTARARRLLAAGGALKCVSLLIGSAVIWLFRDTIFGLFGPAYLEASHVTLVLLLMPLAIALFGPATLVLNVGGHQRDMMIASLAGMGAIAVLTPLAGAAHGVTGAALAAAAGIWIQYGALYFFCRLRSDIDPSAPGSLVRMLRRRGASPTSEPSP